MTKRNEPTPNSSRRAFLGAAGALAAGSAITACTDSADGSPPTTGQQARSGGPSVQGASADLDLRSLAREVRLAAANAQYEAPIATHQNNGDEERYPGKIGSDTRGLPHNERGEVDPAAWALAEAAYRSRTFEDFEKIPLGGSRKFANPIGSLAVSLEGRNVTQIGLPPAPALDSAERGAEAVEQYWQALLRDVAFGDFASHPLALAAASELDKLSGYTGPKADGHVTTDVLFRGSVRYLDPSDPSGRTARHAVPPGVLDGPYLTQFAFRDTPYGTQHIPAIQLLPVAGQSFLADYEEWLAIQNGAAPKRTTTFETSPRHLRSVRDLNEYAHAGNPLFWGALLQLSAGAGGTATSPAGIGAPLAASNPYLKSKTQGGANGTFATGYLQGLLTTGVSRAVRAAYWSKFFVHRSVRPEAFGGLVHHRVKNGVAEYPIHADLLGSKALEQAASTFGSHLLPHAYPEGAPLHGSYPAGSAAIAGVSATLIKAFFDESFVIPNPVVPDPGDPTKLVPYTGPPLTVGGELNKLAVNYTFGRVLSGIHWRSDSAAGLALGEEVAISILQDERRTFREPFAGFSFTKFDGTKIVI